VASCAPPIRHSNVYGIDMPSPTELVAHGRTTPEIAEAIGADLVIFQTLPDLISSVQQFNPSLKTFDCSVFSGEYVTGGVNEEYLNRIDTMRSENAKRNTPSVVSNRIGETAELAQGCSGPLNGADETIGLYNSWSATSANELANRALVS